MIQIWDDSQCRFLEKKLDKNVPLSFFDSNSGVVSVWYHENIFDIWSNLISEKAKSYKNFISESMNEYAKNLDIIEPIWHKKKKLDTVKELRDFYDLAIWSWIGLSISYCLPMMKTVTEAEKCLGMSLRERSADFLELSDHVVQETLRGMFPELGDLIKFLTIEEVESNKIPMLEELEERRKHYIYYNFKLYTKVDAIELAKQNAISLKEEEIPEKADELHGQIAMKGKVTGVARVLYNKASIIDIKDGEILVTAMTTPDYLPAMNKAAAFVTDEGGITCHAAIVARELKKPCVIGTKIATKVIKSGDMVEVDADNGVVRILNK
jgi:phosphohistidine swiveling domain-containing protein